MRKLLLKVEDRFCDELISLRRELRRTLREQCEPAGAAPVSGYKKGMEQSAMLKASVQSKRRVRL